MHVYFFYGFFPPCMLLLPMHMFIFFQKFGSLHFFQNITYNQIDLIWTNGCVKTEFVWCRSNFYIIIWHKSSVKIAYLHLHVYYFFEKNPPYTVISSCTFINFSKKIHHTRLFPHACLSIRYLRVRNKISKFAQFSVGKNHYISWHNKSNALH